MLTQLIWLDFICLYWEDEERIKVCHARAAAGRAVAVARRRGVAWFCHSPLIIAEVSTLLHYGECGLGLMS
jgi:hypothetical protein